MTDLQFRNKSALVTGAGSGIGAATATVLTRHGHHVIATARQVDARRQPATWTCW